ncbi:MAG TPA: hypothetical protein VFM01_17405 [Nakamurella sp.]|nr:hypothetical protein [Nakamurella sp.]
MPRAGAAGRIASGVRVLTAALFGLSVTVLPATPATAAPPSGTGSLAWLQLSTDGIRFAERLPAPLFPHGVLLVPGDSARAQVWVRNGSGDPARLAVRLAANATGFAGDAVIGAAVHSGRPADLPAGGVPFGASARLLDRVPVPAGASVPIIVTVALPTDATRGPRNLSFALTVTLGQTAVRVPGVPADTPHPGSPPAGPNGLPVTGAPIDRLWWLALALVTVGTLMVAASRTDRPYADRASKGTGLGSTGRGSPSPTQA